VRFKHNPLVARRAWYSSPSTFAAAFAGDLMMSLSFCLVCGFKHLLPYFYM
jgi:hypothetical protein